MRMFLMATVAVLALSGHANAASTNDCQQVSWFGLEGTMCSDLGGDNARDPVADDTHVASHKSGGDDAHECPHDGEGDTGDSEGGDQDGND